MTCQDIINKLNAYSPEQYACDWDNVGLQIGDHNREVKSVFIALDPSDLAVEEAVRLKADLLLTHHPLLFQGLKRINQDDFIGRRVIKLIENQIGYYAMHTNFDVSHMGDVAANRIELKNTEVLEVTKEEQNVTMGIGRVGNFQKEMLLSECASLVKDKFSLEHVKVYGDLEKKINRAAICPGSGKSLISEVLMSKADVYITGDVDHHEGIDLVARNVCVIDGGHYGIEKLFIPHMADFFQKEMPQINVFFLNSENPFQIL